MSAATVDEPQHWPGRHPKPRLTQRQREPQHDAHRGRDRRPHPEHRPPAKVLGDDPALTAARLALLRATRQVLANALDVLGVSAPQQMHRDIASVEPAA